MNKKTSFIYIYIENSKNERQRRVHTGIQGKVALVTGSSDKEGIGISIARSLAQRGCSIVLHGSRSGDKVEDIREDLQSQYEVPVHYFRADFGNLKEVLVLFHNIKHLYSGGIDILVNNAAILVTAPVENYGIDRWEKQLRVNLTSAFYLTSLTLANMKQKGWGRIINNSSIWGERGCPNVSGMIAYKHGINGLTKTVALETSGTGVTCNAICPAIVKTASLERFVKAASDETGIPLKKIKRNFVNQNNPSGELLDPDKIGEVAAFLCSTSADEITGALIHVDWGASAQ
ncbi:D-beta-hydroxybutyrate dehydrogenase-like [Saccoglossus kowalevskii]|uniref:3-oxoacyl-[acyl-carrier-protein] reductase n=1 Tax=Saccoglossus kowalevskii TaxID=10224 RepID=A0ABM0MNL8_SACKO|nr:PREDICTED: 3-oxoacyl-[acyl-carrier-protein] reductase, chloroplastic-like [Saccoglossus kowalevskii]